MDKLTKAAENEKTLRSQNAELIRSKAIVESQSQDISRKLEAANQCITDFESKMAKLAAKNTELQTQCAKIQVRPAKETALNEKLGRIPKLSGTNPTENMNSIRQLENDANQREKMWWSEKEQLHNDKMQLKNSIAELTSKFEIYQKRQDEYVRKLDMECGSRIASIISEKRSLEAKLSAMTEEARYRDDELKRSKSGKSIFEHEHNQRESRRNDGRLRRSTYVIKKVASRYHRSSH